MEEGKAVNGEGENRPEIEENAEEMVFLRADKAEEGSPPVSEAEAPEETPQSETDLLRTELESLKAQLAAARADLYNYRQRVERERAKARKLVVEDKILDFLPVLDNLDRALYVPETGTARDVLVGVRMVQRQFLSVLESCDVTIIPADGCPFDPLTHDAVETEFVGEAERDGIILCELLRGYRTSERVLRPAQVRVGRLKI